MAVEDTTTNRTHTVELLASATATNSPPSGASAGLDTNALRLDGRVPEEVSIVVVSTAGSGTMTMDLRIWGYDGVSTTWVPLGTGGDGTGVGSKGSLNEGTQIGVTEANALQHAEPLRNPCHWDRLYLEIVGIGGTSTAITGYVKWAA